MSRTWYNKPIVVLRTSTWSTRAPPGAARKCLFPVVLRKTSSCQSGDGGVEQCVDVTLQVPVSGGGGSNGAAAAASPGRCNYRRPACSSSLRLQMAPYVCQTKWLNKSHPVIQDAALHCGSGNRSLLALIKPLTPSSPLHQTSAVADVLHAVTHFLLLLLLHHLKAQCVKFYVFDIQATVRAQWTQQDQNPVWFKHHFMMLVTGLKTSLSTSRRFSSSETAFLKQLSTEWRRSRWSAKTWQRSSQGSPPLGSRKQLLISFRRKQLSGVTALGVC